MHKVSEKLFAFDQREWTRVAFAEMQHVEHAEGDGPPAQGRGDGVKVRSTGVVECDEFAVDDEIGVAQIPQSGFELLQATGELHTVPAVEANATFGFDGLRAPAVELHFVEPLFSVGRAIT